MGYFKWGYLMVYFLSFLRSVCRRRRCVFRREASNLSIAPFRAASGSCEGALEGASDGALRAFRGANFVVLPAWAHWGGAPPDTCPPRRLLPRTWWPPGRCPLSPASQTPVCRTPVATGLPSAGRPADIAHHTATCSPRLPEVPRRAELTKCAPTFSLRPAFAWLSAVNAT
jgi:hypothetical protein